MLKLALALVVAAAVVYPSLAAQEPVSQVGSAQLESVLQPDSRELDRGAALASRMTRTEPKSAAVPALPVPPVADTISGPSVYDRPKLGSVRMCKASWYDEDAFVATGERFNPEAMTAAHRTLPFGSVIRVTNTRNGLSVLVTINDYGPARRLADRCVDLSRAAFWKIANLDSGIVPVKMMVIKIGSGRYRDCKQGPC